MLFRSKQLPQSHKHMEPHENTNSLGSGSITSVGEERANLSAVVYL